MGGALRVGRPAPLRPHRHRANDSVAAADEFGRAGGVADGIDGLGRVGLVRQRAVIGTGDQIGEWMGGRMKS